MAGQPSNKTVLAIKKESTEGTPVVVAAASDFVAIQPDFTMTPDTAVLENAELTGSIGKAKSILGAENPTASGSFYLRHSGVEGTAPNYSEILESMFGQMDTNATEYDTVSSSTTSLIKVNTGEGAFFGRGHALLIKDPTNGYSIRNVLSVSGDDLTLGQNVAVAPGSGVNLGKAIKLSPVNVNHPSNTYWEYLANGAAINMIAGGKTTQGTVNIAAGDLINVNYSIAGSGFYWDPINVTSSNKYIDFNDGGVKAAVLTVKFYKSPHELATAMQDAMNAVSSGFTVTYSDSTGKFTFVKASGTFSLLWQSGTNTASSIGSTIGFDVSANDTSALAYTADNAMSWAAPYTPSYDSAQPLVAKYNEAIFGDATDITCFGAQSVTMAFSNDRQVIPDICQESGIAGSIFSARTVEFTIKALLTQYEAKKFERYRLGTKTMFTYNAGNKSGGNWKAGECVNIYCPTGVITSLNVTDTNGLLTLEMKLQAYVEAGLGEIYMNFL